MFNFYVVSMGHDTVTDAGRATTCRRKFKAPWLQTEITKIEVSSKNMSFQGNSLKISDQKNQKIQSSHG